MMLRRFDSSTAKPVDELEKAEYAKQKAAQLEIENVPNASREVKIGMNLISLVSVNDKEQTFTANVFVYVTYDCKRLPKQDNQLRFFRPWIQFHNAKNLVLLQNDGMVRYNDRELERIATSGGDTVVTEMFNYCGEFSTPLDLRAFPFDVQKLRITLISNRITDTFFIHAGKERSDADRKNFKLSKWHSQYKMGRVTTEMPHEVELAPNEEIIPGVKANAESDTLSEWFITLEDKQMEKEVRAQKDLLFSMKKFTEELQIGNVKSSGPKPKRAAVFFRFSIHDRENSSQNNRYQRLDVEILIRRSWRHVLVMVVLPSAALALLSLCVYSLRLEQFEGDRLTYLVTIALAIIANQFVVQERLPKLAYLTWLDWVLLGTQAFVYLMILLSAISTVNLGNPGSWESKLDMPFLYISLGIMGASFVVALLSAWTYWKLHKEKEILFRTACKQCFPTEQQRIKEIREKHTIKLARANAASNARATASLHDNRSGDNMEEKEGIDDDDGGGENGDTSEVTTNQNNNDLPSVIKV